MVFWPEFRISPIHLVVLLTSCVFPVFGVHWVGLQFSGIWWNFVGLSFAKCAMSLRDDGNVMAVAELH